MARRGGRTSLMSARLLVKWAPIFRAYQLYGMVFYGALLVKNLCVVLLRSKTFSEFRWLDCYLPGRSLMGSRIPEASKYIGILISVFLIVHRLISRALSADFHLFCLEYCYFDTVKLMELDESPSWLKKRRPVRLASLRDPLGANWHPALSECFVNQLNPRQIVTRPVRTPNRYRTLSLLYLMAMALGLLGNLIMIALNVFTLGPMFLTRRGFELTRKDCVQFIVAQAALQSRAIGGNETAALHTTTSWYELIYKPKPGNKLSDIYIDRPPPLVLPYSELVPFNVYHVLRITTDILETASIWLGIGLYFWYDIFFVLTLAIDLGIYVRHLRRQLDRLIAKLYRQNLERATWRDQHSSSPVRLTRLLDTFGWDRDLQRDETCRIQGAILDFFNQIAFCNRFCSHTILANIVIWICYTFIIFVRTLRVERLQTVALLDKGVQVEFACLFGCCLLIVLVQLAFTSSLDSQSRQLHKRMTVAMALDQDVLSTKQGWIALLKHFEPKRLYCFTIFNHIGLSWLFCLKLVSWVISALVLLKSL